MMNDQVLFPHQFKNHFLTAPVLIRIALIIAISSCLIIFYSYFLLKYDNRFNNFLKRHILTNRAKAINFLSSLVNEREELIKILDVKLDSPTLKFSLKTSFELSNLAKNEEIQKHLQEIINADYENTKEDIKIILSALKKGEVKANNSN